MTTDYGPPDTTPTLTTDTLDQARNQVDSHHQRIDQKAGVLCALNLGAITLTGAALTRPDIPGWAVVAAAAGTLAPLAGSTLTALRAFLPRLRGGLGFVAYATADSPDGVLAALTADRRHQAANLGAASGSVYRKYRSMRTAVLLTASAIVWGGLVAAAVGVSRLAGLF